LVNNWFRTPKVGYFCRNNYYG